MEIKEQIINAAIDLIKETNGSIDKITIRQIAKRAGVGVGLINYHFQSKKNLIDLCVQQIISGVIAQSKPNMEKLSPMEKLKCSIKVSIDFLMDNPEISKISILDDFIQGQANDNTFQTLERYYFYANNLRLNEDVFFKAVFLIHGLQGIFLRSKLYKDKFDFSDKMQRDSLIDNLVEKIFGVENE
jgi:AcrR family transcriptional regulator